MEIELTNIDKRADPYEVKEALAKLIHSDYLLDPRNPTKTNFKVSLDQTDCIPTRNNGKATLILPDARVGTKLMRLVSSRNGPRVLIKKRCIFFWKTKNKARKADVETLAKVPYRDPALDRQRDEKLLQLNCQLRLNLLQFGVWGTIPTPRTPGVFCWEWSKSYTSMQTDLTLSEVGHKLALVYFEYTHKIIRIQLGDPSFDHIAHSVVLKFVNIKNIWVGFEIGNPFICFELYTPPILEQEYFNRSLTGILQEDARKFRERVGSLDASHKRVCPYAYQVRVTLYQTVDLEKFRELCVIANLPKPSILEIESRHSDFFSSKKLTKVQTLLRSVSWPVAFQIEALLHNGLVTTEDLTNDLWPTITEIYKKDPQNTAHILRQLVRERSRPSANSPSPLTQLNNVYNTLIPDQFFILPIPSNMIYCQHVTFTPTRMTLEGPYPIQSNRVIRRYSDFHDSFIRVDFRDEDRLQYRWDREVDGSTFLKERVGGILHSGFDLGGRHFEFLGYSSSALRDHAVWFVSPFQHPVEGLVTPSVIRRKLGNLSELLLCPAKYAARLAQGFTATDPSVRISREQWTVIPDIVAGDGRIATEGVGTISRTLAKNIWAALSRNTSTRSVFPSAFQIRFLGYKGVVSVDDQLDGIMMCLRPSMEKFTVNEVEEADIEIAQAFSKPGQMQLNRPLIMIMEDRGVRMEAFRELQDRAVGETSSAKNSIYELSALLKRHSFGPAFQLSHLLQKLAKLGLEFDHHDATKDLRHPFLDSISHCAINSILRDLKYRANIPVPEGWRVVGVADEGPTYEAKGIENVFCLQEGEIFVCIQVDNDSEPIYLDGMVDVSRSPALHPGDVQRAWAIGKPPDDVLCIFRNLKNCVVFSTKGDRPLPSKLAGGDLDGDHYDVCAYLPMVTGLCSEPAEYPNVEQQMIDEATLIDEKTGEIDAEKVIPHVCDFIVEYINSDVLGLLSDNHLILADQSSEGVFDAYCLALAELCSQAVDYPKNGKAVDIRNAPRRLIPFKPDWKEGEEDSPRSTDFYYSNRALGHLYRNIKVSLEPPEVNLTYSKALKDDPIFIALNRLLKNVFEKELRPEHMQDQMKPIFRRYYYELRYICCTHTLSDRHGVELTEEEIVVGTILARCTQHRWRKERMYRMREHTAKLVKDTLSELQISKYDEFDLRGIQEDLSFAWASWQLCKAKLASFPKPSDKGAFGLNSFAFILLYAIFDCLDRYDSAL